MLSTGELVLLTVSIIAVLYLTNLVYRVRNHQLLINFFVEFPSQFYQHIIIYLKWYLLMIILILLLVFRTDTSSQE